MRRIGKFLKIPADLFEGQGIKNMGMTNDSFAHKFDVPFSIREMTPICFSITAQIPLIHDFMLSIRQCLISTCKNHHSLFSTKPTMTSLLALFLRLAATNSADRSLLSTFTHNVCNVMRGRILSLRHSVKHYKAPGINDCEFISVNGLLKILYYLGIVLPNVLLVDKTLQYN